MKKTAFSPTTNDGAAWIGGGLSWVVSPSIFKTSDFGRDYAWTYIFGGKIMREHISIETNAKNVAILSTANALVV